MINWLNKWSIDWTIDRFIGQLNKTCVRKSIDCLIDRSIRQSIVWLENWSIYCTIYRIILYNWLYYLTIKGLEFENWLIGIGWSSWFPYQQCWSLGLPGLLWQVGFKKEKIRKINDFFSIHLFCWIKEWIWYDK